MKRLAFTLLLLALSAVGRAQTALPTAATAPQRIPQESIDTYTKAIESNPRDAVAHYGRGLAYTRTSRRTEAIADFSKAIELNPKYVEAYYARGNTYAAAGEYAQAISDCTKALELNATLADAYFVRGFANASLARTKEASDDLRKAVELKPALEATAKPILAQLNSSPASGSLPQSIQQAVKELDYPDKVAQDLAKMVNDWKLDPLRQKLILARQGYQQRRTDKAQVAQVEAAVARELGQKILAGVSYDVATSSLSDVVRRAEANCLGYTQLIYVLGNSIGLMVKPITVGELAAGAFPSPGFTHIACLVDLADGKAVMVDLGVTRKFVSKPFLLSETFTDTRFFWLLKDKSNPLAIHRKIHLLDRNGLVAAVYSNQGDVYEKSGRHSQAIATLDKAIEIDPQHAQAYYNRAGSYTALGRRDEAIADLTKAIEINSYYAEAYYNRGTAFYMAGQHSQAISDCNKAIELNPKYQEAYHNRACAYLALGRVDDAIADYTKAIALDPRSADSYLSRGRTYARLGKAEEAKRDLRKAVELNPAMKASVRKAADDFKLAL